MPRVVWHPRRSERAIESLNGLTQIKCASPCWFPSIAKTASNTLSKDGLFGWFFDANGELFD